MDVSTPSRHPSRPAPAGRDGRFSAPAGLEVVEELGRGAQTIVYRVRHGAQEYALKVLQTTAGDDESLDRLRREAARLACVGHPGVANVYDVGLVDGQPYLVMDLIAGQRLSDLIASGPLDEERVVAIGMDVAEALTAAHKGGLVHRDVKPDNILVTSEGAARVIDFGLAARSTDERDDAIAGTLAYTAPEQSGMLNRPVDGRADLYALGAVLMECATGAPPFAADDAGELLRMHVATRAPDARSRRPDLSPVLAAIIAKLLAKDPDDRYQTGAGLAADLRQLPAADLVLGRWDEPAGAGYDPPLTGRDGELSALDDGWNRALGGRGGVALIEGGPGSGKSRLLREIASRAHRAGHVVLQASCVRDESSPMAPFRAAVEQYLRVVDRLPAGEKAGAVGRVVSAADTAGSLLKALSPDLATLLGAPDPGEERPDLSAAAAATFLARLARSLGGLMLCIDDMQWIDEPSRQVLLQLTAELPTTPLLVVAAVRGDNTSGPTPDDVRADLGEDVTARVTLGPLDEPATRRLIDAVTGAMDATGQLGDVLAVRCGGNPFVLLEYLNAMVDAGLVRPFWGTWQVDTERLDRLNLPVNAVDLVVRRLDVLDAQNRRLLAVGAAFHGCFTVDAVAAVSGAAPQQVIDVVAVAAAHRLVERLPDGTFAVLHEAIRTALLDGFGAAEVRRLHARIADVIERSTVDEPGRVYALAHHLVCAGAGQPVERVVRACGAAGRQALTDQAPAQAVEFLECAVAALTAEGHAADADLLRSLALAYQRTGRSPEALSALNLALDATVDSFSRASILQLIARCNDNAGRPDQCLDAVDRGLAELGRSLPRSAAGRLAVALCLLMLSLLIGATGIGRGTASGGKRDLHALLASLYLAGSDAAVRLLRPLQTLTFVLRQRYHIVRVGDCPAATRSSAGIAIIAHSVGLHRTGARMTERAIATGVALEDPRAVAEVQWLDGIGSYGSGRDLGAVVRNVLEEHGRWLETGMYLDGVTLTCWNHLLRGEVEEAAAWQRRGAARCRAGVSLADGHPFLGVGPAILAMRGRFADASTELAALQAAVADREPYVRLNLMQAAALNAIEQGDAESMIDEVGAALATVHPATMKIMTQLQDVLVYRTYGLVELARTAPTERRVERMAAAHDGVKALGKVVTRPLTRAHHAVLSASMAQVSGDNERALARLATADPLFRQVDAPLIAFEAARVRARALGRTGERDRQARFAASIAVDQGWPHRARWIRAEFSVGAVGGATNTNATATGTWSATSTRGGGVIAAGVFRQRLSALEQVSQAAARVLDPDKLVRIALAETVRILAAERAFLFLRDRQTDALLPHLGRDSDGNDLHDLTNYSSTLVDTVRSSRQAMVVTGTEEGVALGSQSAVVHGLRSMMAAPLLLDGRLLGVVYLDSRVAKGIFTNDDVGILAAITNHIAIAMETARAAQLELEVAAANQQRDVAETLREAMASLSGTLDPTEVLERLLNSVADVLTAEQAWLIVTDQDGTTVHVQAMRGGDEGSRAKLADVHFDLGADPRLAELMALDAPLTATPGIDDPVTFGWALHASGAWLAVPLTVRHERLGLLLLASERAKTFGDAQPHVAATLAGQGMIAYENARLFTEVRILATVDGLTGVANRRHFYQLAARQLAEADATGQPLAALMLDIDHFKKINDTHGHQVGDEVIRAVADRLQTYGRGGDLIGRYGGEEFAILLQPSDDAPAAADRLRRAVSDKPVATQAGPVTVTVSVGVTTLTPADNNVDDLLARADRCLYRAKQTGRNRVVHDG